MEKKYQVFISSTYEDLKEERQGIIQAILEIYHIPIGMEMFSAEDEDQWEIIRRTIDVSDYYVLILGLRYGSKTSQGISYTQKEYEYALSKEIPILAFIMDENKSVSQNQRDDDLTDIKSFREKVLTNSKMAQFWFSADELIKNVSISIMKQIHQKPGIGWVRGDKAEDNQLLTREIVELNKKNRELENKIRILEDNELDIKISHEGNNEVIIQSFRLPKCHEILEFKEYLMKKYPRKTLKPISNEEYQKSIDYKLNALSSFGGLSRNKFKGIKQEEINNYEDNYDRWLSNMSFEKKGLLMEQKTEIFKTSFIVKNSGYISAKNIFIHIRSDDSLIFIPYISDEEYSLYEESQDKKDIKIFKTIIEKYSISDKELFTPPPVAPQEFYFDPNDSMYLMRTNSGSDFYLENLRNNIKNITKENNTFYYTPKRPERPTNSITLECPSFYQQREKEFEFYFVIPYDFQKNEIIFTVKIEAENLRQPITDTIVVKLTKDTPTSILHYVEEIIERNNT